MFDGRNEYSQAIQDARLNTYPLQNKMNRKFFFLNLFIFSIFILVGYLGVDYLKNHAKDFKKTNVLGVNYINPNYKMQQSELMDKIDELHDEVVTLKQEVSMKKIVDNLVIASEESAKNAYVKSSINKYDKSLRTILVQHGDTLVSLAEEFYGSSMAFHKIINANNSLTNESHTIYVGQTIYIPY